MTTTPDLSGRFGESGQYISTIIQSLSLASRFLPIVLFLLALASVSLALGVVLEFGSLSNEEVIHGPFKTQPGTRDASVGVGQAYHNFACCVGARPDDYEHRAASGLRAWLNGRELGPSHDGTHSAETAGFIHWQDETVRFSIPDSVVNDQTATLRVRYPVQYSIEFFSLNELMVVILVVLAGFCGLAARILPALQATLRAGIVASSAAFALYVIFLAAGYEIQQPVPVTYIFHYLPIDGLLNAFEPYLPVIVVAFAILLAGLNWGLGRDGDLVPSAAQAESRTVSLWGRLGFFSTAGILYLFIAASALSGHVAAQDVLESNIGGFVPYGDAADHFGGALHFLIFNQIDPWNLRRPLATLVRSETIAFGGLDFVGTILMQTALLSFAIFWGTNAIMKWRGVAAGLVFWAMAFILFRPFAITTLTEPLALFWSFCSIPFFIHALRGKSAPHVIVAMAFLFVALFIRMGAMFVMPFMVLWALLYLGTDFHHRFRNAVAVSTVLLIVLLGNLALDKIYGHSDSELGGNFGSTLCGMSVGGNWSDCYTRYADETKGKTEAQQADFFYRTAAQNVLHDPRNFMRSMRNNLRDYGRDLYSLPLTWYLWPYSSKTLSFALYIISLAGWVYAARESTNRTATTFAIFMGLGIITSVPFIYMADAKRVLYATNPLLALLIAGGFGGGPCIVGLSDERLKWQAGAVALPAAIVTAILLPFGLRAAGIGEMARMVPVHVTGSQRVIAGNSLQTGFVVLPDMTQLLPDVPSMHITKFREFITANREIPANVVQMFPKPPFALVYPLEMGQQDGYAYFLSPKTFRDKTVEAWKVSFTPLNSVQLNVTRDSVRVK